MSKPGVAALVCYSLVTISAPACTNPASLTVTLQPGWNLVCDPLTDCGTNFLDTVLPTPAAGTADGSTVDLGYQCVTGFTSDYVQQSAYPDGYAPAPGYPDPGNSVIIPAGAPFAYFNDGVYPITCTFYGTPMTPSSPPSDLCACGQTNLMGNQTLSPASYPDVTGFAPTNGSMVAMANPGSTSGFPDASFSYYTYSAGVWSPSPPSIPPGQAAWFFIPCGSVAPCGITMQCPNDIVITSCTPVQQFYAPIVTDSCCSTPPTVTCFPPSGSYFYPYASQWVSCIAADGCGNSNGCGFYVTVQPPTGIQLTCAPDKTVTCGTPWTFDPPAMESCCKDVRVIPLPPVTNGMCPQQITETWLFVDGCGDTNSCSQTVTVLGCVPPPPNMVAWWPGDGNANDIIGTNAGTLMGNTVFAPGEVAQSFKFDGVYSWVQTANSPSLNITGPVTVDAWIYLDAINTAPGAGWPIVWKGATSGADITSPYSFGVQWTNSGNNHLYGTIGDGISESFLYSSSVLLLNQWYHVAFVADGTNLAIYINGALDSTAPQTVTAAASPYPMVIGGVAGNPVNNWNGNIDELEIFNRALSQTEINALYLAGPGGKCKTPEFTCPTNKSVECGSAWTFDPPAVSPCDVIMAAPPVTNGICPKVVTETWTIENLCAGTIHTCSQAVTLVDTTPPLVHCGSQIVTVALNENCELVIPAFHPPASDNCTPANQLLYYQSPPPGYTSIVPFCDVGVLVYDLCGNHTFCGFHVYGVDKLGPVITAPSNVVATNCIVPCVIPLVSVKDNCCTPDSISIEQRPPCGTPMGPGFDSVTVIATDCHGNTSVKSIPIIVPSSTSFLSNLYNTGVLSNHLVEPYFNFFDLNYTLGPVPAGTPSGPSYFYQAPHAFADQGAEPWTLPPPYLIAASEWISPQANGAFANPSGNFIYTNQFVLPPGVNPATASISGRWAADNGGTMTLNNLPIASGGVIASPYGFTSWHPFTITSGFLPNPQTNTLLFVVTNTTAYTGLRVEFISANASCDACVTPYVPWQSPARTAPLGGHVVLSAAAAGTPPLTYQWSRGGQPLRDGALSDGSAISGTQTPALSISNVTYASAGLYTLSITGPCGPGGGATSPLRVAAPRSYAWGSWDVAQLDKPLAATIGSDLALVGTSDLGTNYSVTAGTTDDFGLPGIGGQIVDVMHVAPLPPDTTMQIPPLTPGVSNAVGSYTVVMDLYQPSSSVGAYVTLFENANCCAGGKGGGENLMAVDLDGDDYLHLTGSADGAAFDAQSPMPFAADQWNRLALVVDNPLYDGDGDETSAVTATLYLNGQPVANTTASAATGFPVDWSVAAPSLLSRQTNDCGSSFCSPGDFYVAALQFHSAALGPEAIAGLGGPDTGPLPLGGTTLDAQPELSATLQDDGTVAITWIGQSFKLQETDGLQGQGTAWSDSTLDYTESQTSTGQVMTTAKTKPPPDKPAKFYRLVFAP